MALGLALGLRVGLSVGAKDEQVPSMAPGAAHVLPAPLHTRVCAQSDEAQHPSPVPHLTAHSPPPSIHVSVPLRCPSLQSGPVGDSEGEALGNVDGDALGFEDGLVDGFALGLVDGH